MLLTDLREQMSSFFLLLIKLSRNSLPSPYVSIVFPLQIDIIKPMYFTTLLWGDNMKKRKSIPELNIVRAIAMIAVVLIHATAPSFGFFTESDTNYAFYLFLNRFARFCVPLFIFMSSFVLFYNYFYKESNFRSWMLFYKKRILYIFVPYLVWSLFYLLYTYLNTGISPAINSVRINLLFGLSKYHLYYIVVLIQFYIMFPLLISISKKVKVFRWAMLFLGVIIQFLFINLNNDYQIFTHTGSIIFNYFGYILFGAWVGVYYEKIIETLRTRNMYLYLSGMIMTIFGTLHWLTYYFPKIGKITIISYYFDQIFFIFCSLAIVFFMLLSYKARLWNVKVTNSLLALGHYSFGIYLIHPFILDINDKYLSLIGDINIHLFVIERFLVAIFASFLIVHLILKFFKYNWVLFGPLSIQLPKATVFTETKDKE